MEMCGSQEQKEKWLPMLAAGEAIGTIVEVEETTIWGERRNSNGAGRSAREDGQGQVHQLDV